MTGSAKRQDIDAFAWFHEVPYDCQFFPPTISWQMNAFGRYCLVAGALPSNAHKQAGIAKEKDQGE